MVSDIELKAMHGDAMPDGLCLPEQALFLGLRCLYREYRQKVISKQTAKHEKALLLSAYEKEMLWHRIDAQSVRRQAALAPFLSEAEKHGCEICKKMCRILDGRDKE